MSLQTDHRPASNTRYLNAVLTAIACLLLLNLLAGGGVLPRSASAVAQDEGYNRPSALPFNSGDQRNRMTSALESIDARLANLEAKLEKGLSVKVTDMPPVRIAEGQNKDGGERRADKPAPKVEVKHGPAPAAADPAADPK